MACYHPSKIRIQRKLSGDRTRTDDQMVGCGKCLGCRSDQAREWAIRIYHEAMVREPSWFVTLTYAPEHVPEHGSLDPEHPTLFLKRLRRHYSGRRITYYLCGEYGDRTRRPHYHAVLSGLDLLDRDRIADRNGIPVFTSATLEERWSHGLVEFTSVSYSAAAYVAGYVQKKIAARGDQHRYTRVDPVTGELHEVHPDYARMSRNPALGRTFLEQYWQDIYPNDFVVIEGKEFKPPRYYDRWMDQRHPEIMEEVRHQRYQDATEIGDEKLIMKEKIHRARLRLFNNRDSI